MKRKTVVFLAFLTLAIAEASCLEGQTSPAPTVVWQPSHQADTSPDLNEAAVCNSIVEFAMAAEPTARIEARSPAGLSGAALPKLDEHKVWSYGVDGLHHAISGTNTMAAHTSAVLDGKRSGYAYELEKSNALNPLVFVGVHVNGGMGRHAVWGYIHEGDRYEAQNRVLAAGIIEAISRAAGLENRGVLLDSSTGRNDYRCKTTGELAFYSIDENVNKAPYRVFLEIGDNQVSRDFLLDEENRRKIGEAIKKAVARFVNSAAKGSNEAPPKTSPR